MDRPDRIVPDPPKTLANGTTLPGSPPSRPDFVKVPGPSQTISSLEDEGGAERYESRGVMATGGMGEVRLCRDRRIGREVALKAMRPATVQQVEARARFLREARVQGQLEHPSVVPVYDLGVGADGAPFFTMKRVRGLTLEQIIAGCARGEVAVTARYSRRRLLTAFGSLCLAVDFAHTRGVLHRDLKPGNVMLGDFGEVHVLDWGLAKIDGVADPLPDEVIDDGARGDSQTVHGQLLGTPGYMAPEQARGEISALDARVDVYALGAILFELLTLQPLHTGETVRQRVASTLRGAEARASMRTATMEVPPELEAICVRATALDPEDRYATARELSDAIERYLDGDRDLQRRRELASVHADAAQRAAARASGRVGPEARGARGEAMREVTRALALDPEHAGALGTLAQLLTDVPDDLPPEAEAELAESASESRARAARYSAIRYALWFAFVPMIWWMGARDVRVACTTVGALLAAVALASYMWRRRRADALHGFWLLVLSSTAIGWMSSVFGPFLLVPSLAATNTMLFAVNVERSMRRVVLTVGLLGMVVPFMLEAFGWVPEAYGFSGDQIAVYPRMVAFPAAKTLAFLLITSATLVVTPTLMVGRMRDALAGAERRLFLHSWHLRQLVPDGAGTVLKK